MSVVSTSIPIHYENTHMQYAESFSEEKNENFNGKNIFFNIFAQIKIVRSFGSSKTFDARRWAILYNLGQ